MENWFGFIKIFYPSFLPTRFSILANQNTPTIKVEQIEILLETVPN
jgi:hypothetical protein